MTNRTLDPGEINRLTPAEHWSVDLNVRAALAEAFNVAASEAIINNKVMSITYKDGRAFVKPKEGFTPCGWFEVKPLVKGL